MIKKTINELLLTPLGAYSTRVQYLKCGLSIRATLGIMEHKETREVDDEARCGRKGRRQVAE